MAFSQGMVDNFKEAFALFDKAGHGVYASTPSLVRSCQHANDQWCTSTACVMALEARFIASQPALTNRPSVAHPGHASGAPSKQVSSRRRISVAS